WLACAARLSNNPARNAVRRLVDHGALRLVDRTKAGHVVEVRLPDEIRAARPGPSAPRRQPRGAGFRETKALRRPSTRASVASAFLSAPTYRPRSHPPPCRSPPRVGAQFLPQPPPPLSGKPPQKRATAPPGLP